MKIKTAMLATGMVIAIISMIGNYLFFVSKQLKEPIMLKHYYDTQVGVGSMLEFQYVTNRNDDTEISWFIIPNSDIRLPVSSDQTYQTYRHHQLKNVYTTITEEIARKLNKSALEMTQLEVYFSNGDMKLMDIGEIILHEFKENNSPFDFRAGGGSTDNTGFSVAVATKDVNITGLEIPYADKFEKSIKLYVGDTERTPPNFQSPKGELLTIDSFPIHKKKGDYLSFDYQIQFEQDDKNKHHLYTFEIKLVGNDENGETFSFPDTIFYKPELTDKDIAAIVQGET
ncbi:hypothetical protein [Lederbergia panacisoli]|uniref:hypothetical protein n=1 Tax=Lederbergia panacisoli TaxID=1255251 RepID=UPI00214CA96A|nr:hypothetical protein [Lederbergia panacisoli]MCR2823433.1 hypothetical protein [Lederbergia panacisoli]